MDNKYDVFISYSRHDTNVVNEFVERLESEGFSVWIDRDGIESGDAFKRIILQAIKHSAVVLFFSSQFSNQSGWTAKEIGVAVKYMKPVIPILLDGFNFNEEVEFDLINLDFIDYQDVTVRGAMMDRLMKSLKAKIPNPIGLKKAEEARLKNEVAEREWLERERQQKVEAERGAKEEEKEREVLRRKNKFIRAFFVVVVVIISVLEVCFLGWWCIPALITNLFWALNYYELFLTKNTSKFVLYFIIGLAFVIVAIWSPSFRWWSLSICGLSLILSAVFSDSL